MNLLASVSLVLLVMLIVVWIERRTIARDFIDRELRRRGVAASYRIEQLSIWRQRLKNVVIGDPHHPDLVADWVELRTSLYPWRADVWRLSAGKLRMRGRIANGKLMLGALDRLMPPSTPNRPFSLPHIDLAIADGEMALETQLGALALGFSGNGMLDDGFTGRLSASSARLDLGSCGASAIHAVLSVRTAKAGPTIAGPVTAASFSCGATRASGAQAMLALKLDPKLDGWQGSAGLKLARVEQPQFRMANVAGWTRFAGNRFKTSGQTELSSGPFALDAASGGGLGLSARYAAGSDGLAFSGTARVRTASLASAVLATLRAQADIGAGTPIAPIVAQIVRAGAMAGERFDADADLDVRMAGDRVRVTMSRLRAASATGAQLAFAGTGGLQMTFPDGASRVDGTLTLAGGNLPNLAARLSQAVSGAPVTGSAVVEPIAAGGARLALDRIAFGAAPAGTARLSTTATVSGPLTGGRVEGLSLPIDLRWTAGRVALNPGCADTSFERLTLASLILERSRLRLCPIGAAMLGSDGKSFTGGVLAAFPQLRGSIGGSPLALSASRADFTVATGRFAVAGFAARVGVESVTRLDIGQLDGQLQSGSVAGSVKGLAGQIASVPLLISGSDGQWRFAAGRLALNGGLALADAANPARFKPLASHDVVVTLENGRIVASATLETPQRAIKIVNVKVTHDLGTGLGRADLVVPGIQFSQSGLQPSDLTPLTYGIIADVDGIVSGNGQILWDRDGVTSDGTFRTAGTDLAAAFGTVRKLATEVHFNDLLDLKTEPGQVATIAEVNPGVSVTNGRISYRLLGDQRVQVEGARWPFAGGELILEPAVLDFSLHQERRMTFRVVGADAAQFLKEMAFDNLDASGTFDGTLPMVFDEKGGRIEGGLLRARGGGTVAYVGEVSQRDLGTWGNVAFQALKSLNYRNLGISMNGPLDGEMVTDIRFDGINQGKGAKSNFLIRRLARLPFVFNVQIRAPFRQLLDSVQNWYDPQRLIERNLPVLIEEQNKSASPETTGTPATIQPSESEKMR